MSERKRIKESRGDITDWLTHFTRNTDRSDKDSAKRNLMAILKDGVLRPGWAVRGKDRTVYGPRPAVCFTEQPLGEFAAYVKARRNRNKVAPYGVIVRRGSARAAGARPAIYGLSNIPKALKEHSYGEGARMLETNLLPASEQYRYVTFDGGVDWTHEREWRWPAQPDFEARYGGFPLWDTKQLSRQFAHVFVATRTEAVNLANHLPTLFHDLAERRLFHTRLLEGRARILSLEELAELGSKKAEQLLG